MTNASFAFCAVGLNQGLLAFNSWVHILKENNEQC